MDAGFKYKMSKDGDFIPRKGLTWLDILVYSTFYHPRKKHLKNLYFQHSLFLEFKIKD